MEAQSRSKGHGDGFAGPGCHSEKFGGLEVIFAGLMGSLHPLPQSTSSSCTLEI